MSTDQAPLLEAVGLTKRFGGVIAVNDVALSMRAGELVGLIGPNGSGKTTTINLITGALRPDRGTIHLAGVGIVGNSAHQFARRGVARTFQVPRLFKRMTVLENVIVPALVEGRVTWRDARTRGRKTLEFLRLEALAGADARALSGGQQKLLELARALMLKPRVLLLDEPFAGVHPHLLAQIIEHIRVLNAQGYTIAIVDHNLDAIRSVVPRTVVMARGRGIADGPTEQVLQNPDVVKAYTGSRKANESQ